MVKISFLSLLTALHPKMGEDRDRDKSVGKPFFLLPFCYYFYGNLTIKYLVKVTDVLSVVVTCLYFGFSFLSSNFVENMIDKHIIT